MPIPKPNPREKRNDFIPRCISILSKEDPGRPNEQIVAMCETSWKQNKSLAQCYINKEECIADQMSKGKVRQDSVQICEFLEDSSNKVDANNLIMLNPDMDVSKLPREQLVFYSHLLSVWKKKKRMDEKKLSDFTVSELESVHNRILSELKNDKL